MQKYFSTSISNAGNSGLDRECHLAKLRYIFFYFLIIKNLFKWVFQNLKIELIRVPDTDVGKFYDLKAKKSLSTNTQLFMHKNVSSNTVDNVEKYYNGQVPYYYNKNRLPKMEACLFYLRVF